VSALPRATATLALLTALAASLSAGVEKEQEGGATVRRDPRVIAVVNATIMTVAGPTIPRGTLLIKDGRIAAVGERVEVPHGAEIVDAAGRFLTPGLIDSHSHTGAVSINDAGLNVTSMVDVADALNPADINLYRELAGGLTAAAVLHGSVNAIGGKAAVIKLRWGVRKPEELLFEGATPRLKMALGENPRDMRQSWRTGPVRFPTTRRGTEYVIREAFLRAEDYRSTWREYEKQAKPDPKRLPPRRDLQLEALAEVLDGTRALDVHSYRADDLLMLMRVGDEMGFKVALFQHTVEGYKVAKEMAAHGAAASAWIDYWGAQIEEADMTPFNVAILMKAGVLVSLGTDFPDMARRLNLEAGKAVRYVGLTDEQALALITLNPARQLGIDGRVGSLEVGKDADVVMWDGHPLSSYATVSRVFIDGTVYYDRAAEEARFAERQRIKAKLLAVNGPANSRSPDPSAPAAPGATADRVARPRQVTESPREPVPGVAQSPVPGTAASASDTVAIVHGRVVPVTSQPIENGTVIISNGRIVAVGPGLPAPPGAKVIDASGQDVYPGWINARSTIGLADPGSIFNRNDVTETGDFNPQLRTHTSYFADSDKIAVARANGVTTVATTPAGGILAGAVAVMNLDGWNFDDATLRPSAGIAFHVPELTPRRAGAARLTAAPDRPFEQLERERDARLATLSDLLQRARAYATMPPSSHGRDLVLESLEPVVKGTLPLFAVANLEAEIRAAIAFSDRERIRIVISGGLEAPLVAPLLAERDIPVVLGPLLVVPTREDMWHAANYEAAGQLVRAGVRIAFGTADATNARLLPYHAALSVAWGLPRDAAVRALTIDAATILGVDNCVGSIEPGKAANLFIARGDPLEVRTEITEVIINGRIVGTRSRETELFERYNFRVQSAGIVQ